MNLTKSLIIGICFAVAVVVVPRSTDAAMLFADSLQSGSLPANFTLGSSAGGRAPTFDANGVTFAGDGDNARNYLRTDDMDYHNVSFVAYVTVNTKLGTSFDNDSQLFFGLGAGEPGQYGVPDRQNDPGIYLGLNDDAGLAVIQMTTSGSTELDTLGYVGVNTIQPLTMAVRFVHDAVNHTVTFSVDYNYAGDDTYAGFTAFQTIGPVAIPADTLADWAGSARASIVFGGDSDNDSDLLVYDFAVVPEPATLALLLAGAPLALKRRRG